MKGNSILAEVLISYSKAALPKPAWGTVWASQLRPGYSTQTLHLQTHQWTITLEIHQNTPASTHNNRAGCAAARRHHSGRKLRKRPPLSVLSWLRRHKLTAQAATTKTVKLLAANDCRKTFCIDSYEK